MSEPTPLQHVQHLLAEALRLSEAVLADKSNWTAAADERQFFLDVAAITTQTIPPNVFASADVALGFLLMARFNLETLQYSLERDARS